MTTLLESLAELSKEKRALLASRLPQMSFAQQRLWFLDQLEPDSHIYNCPAAVRLTGRLDVGALERTFGEIIRRHQVLRTTFLNIEERAVQIISSAAPLTLEVEDLNSPVSDAREAELERMAHEEARRPFDLTRGPLLRVRLLRLAAEEHVCLLTMHHIISDGWSVGILINEVMALYEAYTRGADSTLPELPIQYADYAAWQRQLLQGEALERRLQYWRERLGDNLPVLELPTDRPRPSVQSYRGGQHRFTLTAEVTEQLRELAAREGATLFMVLLAAFKVLLSRYTGQTDVVVGTDIAGRNRAEVEGLIGFFVNQLVMRTDLSGEPTFAEVVRRVREVCLGAYAHQDVPFEKVVEELQPERSLGRSPLFQIKLVLQNAPQEKLAVGGLEVSPLLASSNTARIDLTLMLEEQKEGLSGTWVYSTDLFDEATIASMSEHFDVLLGNIACDPARPVSELDIMSASERQRLLVEFNDTARAYTLDRYVHVLFEEQVERTPSAVAVRFRDASLTYRELNCRANQLAHYLRGLGVADGSLVAVCMDYSLHTLVALLGILKSGGAYLPLDPFYPLERLAFMLEDSAAPILLTEEELTERLPAHLGQTFCLDSEADRLDALPDHNPAPLPFRPDLPAYVIYTSGSTGRPKGVVVPHRALANYLLWAAETYLPDGTALDAALYSSLSFDLTVTSVFLPLLRGGAVVVYRRTGSASPLLDVVAENRVGLLKLTPSHLSLLRDVELVASRLRCLVVGGEALETELARRIDARLEGRAAIYNEYGPTETTVGCMVSRFDAQGERRGGVPIGRPIANTQVYLLDERGRAVGEGMSGELYVGGAGLAVGYLHEAEMTARRFVPHVAEEGERMYRTGDVGRWLPGGVVEYVGREDEQVKYHGHRVELAELGAALSRHPQVHEAVVRLLRDARGEEVLVGYYVTRPEAGEGGETRTGVVKAEELREFLEGEVIRETIPGLLAEVGEIPLTVNGKVDYERLPGVEELRGRRRERQEEGGRTATEELVAGIFGEVLGVEKVGLREQFFEMGGHSLLATQLISRVREVFGVEVGLREVFGRPTVAGLSQYIDEALRDGHDELKKIQQVLANLEELSEEEVRMLLDRNENVENV